MKPSQNLQHKTRLSSLLSAFLAAPLLLLGGSTAIAQETQGSAPQGLTITINETASQEAGKTLALETLALETLALETVNANEKTLSETEAQLKIMSARMETISKELAEVSKQNQVLIQEAMEAVQKAKAEKADLPPLEVERHTIIVPSVGSVRIHSNATPTATRNPREEVERRRREARVRNAEAQAVKTTIKTKTKSSIKQLVGHSSWKNKKSRERVAFSGNASIEEGETVRELVLFSGNAEVQGNVENDVILLAGNLLLRKGSHIGGDAVVLAGNLTVEEGARVDGDTVVSAGKLNVERGAIVLGEQVAMDLNRLHSLDDFTREWQVEHSFHPDNSQHLAAEQEESTISWFAGEMVNLIVRFLFLAATGLLLMTFLPERIRAVGQTVRGRLAASSFIGILAAFSLVPLGAVLTVSIVGIPLVPVLVAGVAFSVVMGMVAVASELGRILPVGRKVPGWLLAAGALLLATLSIVPVIGPFVISCFAITGMGAVLLSRFGDDGSESAPI